MTALEFIKKFGWSDARVCILNCACPEDRWLMRHGELISDEDFDNLKQFADAWELVEENGGLVEALEFIRYAPTMHPEIWKLQDAITLVEQVNATN